MKVRNLRKYVTMVLAVCTVFFSCTGCSKVREDDLQTLEPETYTEDTAEQSSGQERERISDTQQKPEEKAEEESEEKAVPETVFVYVCGAVHSPGVYELEAGARVYEALERAGGVSETAAPGAVNQARVLCDGEQIYIPTAEEWKPGQEAYAGGGQTAEPGRDTSGRVNINTATAEELKTLTGIGDTRAQSILAYREENGPFRSIEDLMNVEGIKEGIFSKIKDSIIVNAGS